MPGYYYCKQNREKSKYQTVCFSSLGSTEPVKMEYKRT